MILKTCIAMLTLTVVIFCSADEQPICSDKILAFTIKDPTNYSVNIKLFGNDSEVIYEKNHRRELHPDAKIKKVLINFSSSSTIITKDFSLDEFDKVISLTASKHRMYNREENLPLSYKITLTPKNNEEIISYTNQCYSGVDKEHSRFLHNFNLRFSQSHNPLQLESADLLEMVEINEHKNEELIRKLFNQVMNSLGYKRNIFGTYVHENSTSANY